MISDDLAARTIAHLRSKNDEESKQLAEEIYAQSYALHPLCENCTQFKHGYGYNDQGFCIKHKQIRNCSDRKECFQGSKEHQDLIGVWRM